MDPLTRIQQEAELRRLTRAKVIHRQSVPSISAAIVNVYRDSVKRTKKLGGIGEVWAVIVPAHLVEHCSLEGFVRGTLSVVVDSSPHLYQLNQLLLAGLRNQLITACRGCGLKKITLKAGSGDSRETRADRRMDFD